MKICIFKFTFLLPIVALGLLSCTTRREAKRQQPEPDPNWTPEIQQRVAQHQKIMTPWVEEPLEFRPLRREIFELRSRLIKAGENVEPRVPGHRKQLQNLELEVRVPETHLIGDPLILEATFHNRGETPIGILDWPWEYYTELIHESGRRIEYWPTPPRARLIPREEDFQTIPPGETYSRKVSVFSHRLVNLPPGRYHVVLHYGYFYRSQSVWSNLQEVRFVSGPEVNGLRASLKLEDAKEMDTGEPPWFSATLTNTSDRSVTLIPHDGILVFTDVLTGKELTKRIFSQQRRGDPPPRPYRTRIDTVTLRPGEEWTTRVAPPAEDDQFGDITMPAWQRETLPADKEYEVQWQYESSPAWAWYIEEGQFRTVSAWTGRLSSEPVPYVRTEPGSQGNAQ